MCLRHPPLQFIPSVQQIIEQPIFQLPTARIRRLVEVGTDVHPEPIFIDAQTLRIVLPEVAHRQLDGSSCALNRRGPIGTSPLTYLFPALANCKLVVLQLRQLKRSTRRPCSSDFTPFDRAHVYGQVEAERADLLEF